MFLPSTVSKTNPVSAGNTPMRTGILKRFTRSSIASMLALVVVTSASRSAIPSPLADARNDIDEQATSISSNTAAPSTSATLQDVLDSMRALTGVVKADHELMTKVVDTLGMLSDEIKNTPPTVSFQATSVAMGATTEIPFYWTPGSAKAAGMQFDVTFPAGVSFVSVSPGPSAIAAEKFVQTSTVNGATRFLVIGINQNILGPGVLVKVAVRAAGNAPMGAAPVLFTNASGTDKNGSDVAISGVAGQITVGM